jgi:adenosylcobinamide-GDP ribazoletransferase
VSGLLVAIRYLTIVPVAAHVPPAAAALGRAAGWFPVVGVALGAALVMVDYALGRFFHGLLAALLTVTVWKILTGGLHLDGLADCLDALGGGTPEHRRAILSDSRIGTFGAVGLILFLMIEIVALSGMDASGRWGALLIAPAIGRATPPLLARLFAAARLDGQGAAFLAHVAPAGAAIALAVAVLVALLALRVVGLVAVVAGALAAILAGRFLARRFGGITGDVLGAGVELSELAAVLTVAAWAGARP